MIARQENDAAQPAEISCTMPVTEFDCQQALKPSSSSISLSHDQVGQRRK